MNDDKVFLWWTSRHIDRALEILGKHCRVKNAMLEISEEFGRFVSDDALRRACVRYKRNPALKTYLRANMDQVEPGAREIFIPQARDYTPPIRHTEQPQGEQKILVISDMHIPECNADLLYRILDVDGDADAVILLGDCLEVEQGSGWGQTQDGKLEEEAEMLIGLVDTLACCVGNVYLVEGNHEYRAKRYLQKNVKVSFHWLTEDRFDLLSAVKRRVGRDNVHYDGGPESWFIQIGNVIFAHPMKYLGITASGQEGRTSLAAWQYFTRKKEYKDLGGVVLGHTHQLYYEHVPGRVRMETGCVMPPPAYALSAKLNMNPWDQGYGIVTLVDGKIDPLCSGIRQIDLS